MHVGPGQTCPRVPWPSREAPAHRPLGSVCGILSSVTSHHHQLTSLPRASLALPKRLGLHILGEEKEVDSDTRFSHRWQTLTPELLSFVKVQHLCT